MRIPIVKDGWWHMVGALIIPGAIAGFCLARGLNGLAMGFGALAVVGSGFMLFFFRDPDRAIPEDPRALVAGADGLIRAIEVMPEDRFLKTEAVRVSIFLSPFNVHINRTPIGGQVTALAYTPGRHLLTISNKASEFNEHSSILVEGQGTRCLVRQIVGPIVRRVIYWLKPEQGLAKGDRIGLMKFGSRLDMYFPAADVEIRVKKGDKVRAGETVVAVITKDQR
ncbi:MAG TPA: phosphatidylserine decarboxylase [Kiritimatiellia bacterium]|nr:phosphatidylserine decarboxylase [Kiritimatiellia bacterium]HRZ11167.1 phosphatidylserine decarboxylase [Kiritimatiellia bacterium]HSA19018.1 phosphatidylserine decarboxylase [Kiritimatiellia bacterium]